MLQHYINHISLVVDRSGSMQQHAGKVVEVFDAELVRLKQRSVDMDQETRISIYLFDGVVECLAFDMDVMRFKTLRGHYVAGGQTALMDAIMKSIADHRQLPELYGDHAFLQYVLTDGEENHSRNGVGAVVSALRGLPAHWTTAILVPDARGVHAAKQVGFAPEGVAVWDTSGKDALEKVGKQFTSAMDNYMVMRSTGKRGTTSFFQLDSSGLSKRELVKVDPATYEIIPVRKDSAIKEYVESWTGKPYRLGSAYYVPTKKVVIQNHKNLVVQEVKTGTVWEGGNLRQLLGLPQSTVEVDPGRHGEWRIFVQSTSVNRKLFAGTFVLVMK